MDTDTIIKYRRSIYIGNRCQYAGVVEVPMLGAICWDCNMESIESIVHLYVHVYSAMFILLSSMWPLRVPLIGGGVNLNKHDM